jgi:PAS domain S-box-containing protein
MVKIDAHPSAGDSFRLSATTLVRNYPVMVDCGPKQHRTPGNGSFMIENREKSRPQTIPSRILLPPLLTLVLFIGTIFLLILPSVETRMMAAKREMIRELTEAAWSVLATCHQKEAGDRLSRSAAQASAIEQLRSMRYGPENKDYFWINDGHPRLIMHPYRTDLEGHDITDFSDPSGKRLFVEMVATVRDHGAGYVDYLWQWKDDPRRIVPKISYVKGFAPWGWIIGTGIYVEDVRAEISAITHKLAWICMGILVLITGLSSFIVWQSATAERRRREADASLRVSEARYRLLTEAAREFILVFDLRGRIQYANRAWLETGGFTSEEMRSRNLVDIIPENERSLFESRLKRRLAGDWQHYLYETSFLTRDGRRIPVEVTSTALVQADKTLGLFFVARDMTERKRAEKQARLHREQLFQADKMATLGTLVSGVAHEINNPISFITLNTPILDKIWRAVLPILDDHIKEHGDFMVEQMPFSQLRDDMPQLLTNIGEGAQRVKAIVEDLRDFARQSPEHMNDRVAINEVAAKAVSLLSNLIKKSTRHFEVDYGTDTPPFAGNRQKIEQVVINLLVNAFQSLASPSKGLRLKTEYDHTNQQVVLEVRDEGCGITEEHLSRIRDPFFTTKRNSGGTGLGLAIAERIVEDHRGRMQFTSVVDQGTTVRVEFPVSEESDPP